MRQRFAAAETFSHVNFYEPRLLCPRGEKNFFPKFFQKKSFSIKSFSKTFFFQIFKNKFFKKN